MWRLFAVGVFLVFPASIAAGIARPVMLRIGHIPDVHFIDERNDE